MSHSSLSDESKWDPRSAVLPPLEPPPRRVFVGPSYVGQPEVPRTGAPHSPSSKYYTLRYLLNALLADGESVVRYVALSEDTAVLVRALRALGASVTWEPLADGAWQVRVRGCAGQPQTPPDGTLHVGNAGAVLRLLLGIGALLPMIRFETDHPDSLGRRPNADLLDALRALGLAIEAREPGGLLPVTLRGGPPRGGLVSVSGARSSQYISALLYLAPLLNHGLRITVTDDLRSAPFIHATLRALSTAGIVTESSPDLRQTTIGGQQTYQARTYDVPGDGPSAAALAAAAMTLGAPLTVERLLRDEEDIAALLEALAAIGAPLTTLPDATGTSPLAMAASARLHGARINGDACIDSVPALVAAACFATGDTYFERVATLRLKESNRIDDLCAELCAAGCDVEPSTDTILVHGKPEGILGGATVSGHDDHRLVQALAIVALRSQRGLTIDGADAVAKSYPWFFRDLERLGAHLEGVPD